MRRDRSKLVNKEIREIKNDHKIPSKHISHLSLQHFMVWQFSPCVSEMDYEYGNVLDPWREWQKQHQGHGIDHIMGNVDT